MSLEQKNLLEEAGKSIQAAKILLQDGFEGYAAARAYYAMFYLAEAMLLSKNKTFSKHKAVTSAFAKEYIVSGPLPRRLHRYLLDGYDYRLSGDYLEGKPITRAIAAEQIQHAEEFLNAIRSYLDSSTPPG